MKPNAIEEVRAEVLKHFDPQGEIANSGESHTSPSGKYRLATQTFAQKRQDFAMQVLRVEVLDVPANESLFAFVTTYHRFFFSWVKCGGHEILICAEDPFGGQTIIDLTDRKMSSYSPGNDGFIWTEHFLSPDESKLAVSGCVWGEPYWVNVYDFSTPLSLPLPLIEEMGIDDEYQGELIGWSDNRTLRFKGPNESEMLATLKEQSA